MYMGCNLTSTFVCPLKTFSLLIHVYGLQPGQYPNIDRLIPSLLIHVYGLQHDFAVDKENPRVSLLIHVYGLQR